MWFFEWENREDDCMTIHVVENGAPFFIAIRYWKESSNTFRQYIADDSNRKGTWLFDVHERYKQIPKP